LPGKGYNGTLFLGPNAQLYAQYGGQEKYLAAKKAFDDSKKKYTNQEKTYQASNLNLLTSLNAPTYGLYAQLNAAKLAHNNSLVSSLNASISSVRSKISENNLQIYVLEDKIKKAQAAFQKKKVTTNNGGAGGTGNNDTVKTPGSGKGPFNFNAPLVNSSYFLNKGDLPKMLPAGSSSLDNAEVFWTKKDYGKGTIQMDRLTNTSELKANAKKEAAKNKIQFDDKMYGFRFQYNPTTVNMSWAGMMGANPVYEAAGLDPAVPMSANLFTGTISFDIILNRIQDIALLDSTGGFTQKTNPYPWAVSTEDRKTIVEKGTMYDLEYLFRTLHGYAFYTNFKSTLMGKTNDPGWLPVRPVELHLGNKLRYRVRVSGLEVVHKIFSEKMIPILSVVTISCNRYWDGPPAKDAKK
jgi:hypothetical protein